jgi:muramoyltetrapeptide carboxypeptidase
MNRLVYPPSLQRGDLIAVVAPSSPTDADALALGIAILKERYSIAIREDISSRFGFFAGDDARRREELQSAIDDDRVRAIIAARGGYGSSRIVDDIDFRNLVRSPKWFVGCSDLTAVSSHLLANFRLSSIHGPMVSRFHRTYKDDVSALFSLLEGASLSKSHELTAISPGRVEGPLIGGNLTVLAHMVGALPKDFLKGAILFLEDIGEKPYRLDRCLTQLRLSGMLDNISGLVFGEFTDCDANPDGVEALDVMTSFAVDAKIPAAAGYPAAHGNRNAPFVQGGRAVLEILGNSARLTL